MHISYNLKVYQIHNGSFIIYGFWSTFLQFQSVIKFELLKITVALSFRCIID